MVVVPDIVKDGAFDSATKDVTYIIHIASPLAKEVGETLAQSET